MNRSQKYSDTSRKALTLIAILNAFGVGVEQALAKQENTSSRDSFAITDQRKTPAPSIVPVKSDLETRNEIGRLLREAESKDASDLSEKQKLLEVAFELSKNDFSYEMSQPFSRSSKGNPKRRIVQRLCETYRESKKWSQLELFLKRHGDILGSGFDPRMGEVLFMQGRYAEARVILRRFVPANKRPVPGLSEPGGVEFGVPFNIFYNTSLLKTEQLTETQLKQIESDFESNVQVSRVFENARIVDRLESSTWREIESLCLRAVRTYGS